MIRDQIKFSLEHKETERPKYEKPVIQITLSSDIVSGGIKTNLDGQCNGQCFSS